MFVQGQLLSVRKQQRRLVESRVAQAHAARNEAIAALRMAEQEVVKSSERIASGQLEDVVQTYRALPAARNQIDSARQRLLECEQRLQAARDELRNVNIAVESLETLRAQRRREYRQEQQADLQKQVEFTVMRRWAQGQLHLAEDANDD